MRTAILAICTLLAATQATGLTLEPVEALIEPVQTAGPSWAPIDSATIQPGVQMVTSGAQCTSNFIFYDEPSPGTFDIYIGYAAHCAGLGGSTDTNGCLAGSAPIGTAVSIDGANHVGRLAWSSWDAMIRNNEPTNSNACAYNDLAIVKIDPRDHGRVNPSALHFGGPTGLCGGPGFGADVISYGNSGLRFGIDLVAPKQGISLGTSGAGWTTTVYMVSPGIPGDSGSGYMDSDHCAFGVTSTVALFPYALSNGISSLQQGLAYAAADGFDATLATATPITSIII